MTQMELADKLNISFQAVSNWERGNSMPDISKLPELAKLFGVSIDEILGEKSELIDRAASGKIDEYLSGSAVSVEQIAQAAPILKPEQVDKSFEKAKFDSLNEIVDILPFVSEDTVDLLVNKAVEKGDYSGLAGAVPFASEETVDKIAEKMAGEGKSIEWIAPFVSEEAISRLVPVIYKERGLAGIENIAMFISDGQLCKIAELEYESHGLGSIQDIAPFLDRNFLDGLAKRAIQKDGIKAIEPIAPFLSRDMLSEYIKSNL